MSQCATVKQWGYKAIITVMFVNYYYLASILCWAIITPNQALFISDFQQGGFRVNALYWGGLLGCYLGFRGLGSAVFNACGGLRKWAPPITIKSMIDYGLCASFILMPLLVLKYNLIIRASVHPLLLMLLTVIFLITITHRYFQIERTYFYTRALRMVAHA